MKKLTENQITFLLRYFFKNEKYPGAENIARTLLEDGECVVAGNHCIWHGGIGNFIETKQAEGIVGCLLYTFDLETFLTSEWYNNVKNQYLTLLSDKELELRKELSKLDIEYKEIMDL